MNLFVLISLFLISVIFIIYVWRKNKKEQSLYKNAFESVFSDTVVKPKFESGYHYGFPYFKITFESQSTLNKSKEAGCMELFTQKIDELCKDKMGSKSNPFDASKTILFTYEGEIDKRVVENNNK